MVLMVLLIISVRGPSVVSSDNPPSTGLRKFKRSKRQQEYLGLEPHDSAAASAPIDGIPVSNTAGDPSGDLSGDPI